MKQGLFALLLGLLAPVTAWAEVSELRISQQYGVGYVVLEVAQHQGYFDEQAKAQGLPGLKVSFVTLSGGSSTNDALLSDSIDIATGGVGAFLPVWDKTRGSSLDVRGIAAIATLPIALVTTNPAVRSIKDFTPQDRIALPSVKSSVQSALLQIAAEKEFGPGKQEQLDDLTVSMKHPDAYAALASARSEITAHFGVPPFQQMEQALPNGHKLLDSYEVLGGPSTFNMAWAKGTFRANNPKVVAAFLAALRQANAFIIAHPEEAARINLLEDGSTKDGALVLSIIKDPQSYFTVTPLNTGKFADFQSRTGILKHRAESWKDLFFPEIYGEQGS